jgi:hypothetical protein
VTRGAAVRRRPARCRESGGPRFRHREQPDLGWAQEHQRVQILEASAAHPPVQAGRMGTAGMSRLQQPDHGTGTDDGACRHRGPHRLIGRAETVVVVHRHDAPTAHRPREHDRAGARREHGLAGRAHEVDAPVPGPVRVRRLPEPGRDHGSRQQRPGVPGAGHRHTGPGRWRARNTRDGRIRCRCVGRRRGLRALRVAPGARGRLDRRVGIIEWVGPCVRAGRPRLGCRVLRGRFRQHLAHGAPVREARADWVHPRRRRAGVRLPIALCRFSGSRG